MKGQNSHRFKKYERFFVKTTRLIWDICLLQSKNVRETVHIFRTKIRKKSGEVLEKMQVNRLQGQTFSKKKSLAVGITCMPTYGPAPGLNGRTVEIWVLNRWVFNFCVRCTPLRGPCRRVCCTDLHFHAVHVVKASPLVIAVHVGCPLVINPSGLPPVVLDVLTDLSHRHRHRQLKTYSHVLLRCSGVWAHRYVTCSVRYIQTHSPVLLRSSGRSVTQVDLAKDPFTRTFKII